MGSERRAVRVDWLGLLRGRRAWEVRVSARLHPVTDQVMRALAERDPGLDADELEAEALFRMVAVATGQKPAGRATLVGVREALGLPPTPEKPLPPVAMSVAYPPVTGVGERSVGPGASPPSAARPGAPIPARAQWGRVVASVVGGRYGYER